MPGSYTQQEILSQPCSWAKTIENLAQIEPPCQLLDFKNIIFIGCGSTYYLSIWASRLAQSKLCVNAAAFPSSEIWFSHKHWVGPIEKPLLIAVSRSGETSETIRAVEEFQKYYGDSIIAITCYPDSTLAKLVKWKVLTPEGQEESIAQTRSFTNMMLAVLYLIEGGIPESVRKNLQASSQQIMDNYLSLAYEIGGDLRLERFFFLGNGALYGLASEIMLKMKEMSLSYSEAFHFMEFRHGPMSMVNDKSLVIGYLDNHYRSHSDAVMKQMQSLGAKTLGEGFPAPKENTWRPDWFFDLACDLPEIWLSPLYLPLLQALAFQHSLAKGLNPDRPLNLTAVVELDA